MLATDIAVLLLYQVEHVVSPEPLLLDVTRCTLLCSHLEPVIGRIGFRNKLINLLHNLIAASECHEVMYLSSIKPTVPGDSLAVLTGRNTRCTYVSYL
jgi:hypothetical protein